MDKAIKKVMRKIKEVNPLDNKVEIDEYDCTISWDIEPSFSLDLDDIDKTKFDIEVKKGIAENSHITLRFKGRGTLFTEGLKDDNFGLNIEFRAKL